MDCLFKVEVGNCYPATSRICTDVSTEQTEEAGGQFSERQLLLDYRAIRIDEIAPRCIRSLCIAMQQLTDRFEREIYPREESTGEEFRILNRLRQEAENRLDGFDKIFAAEELETLRACLLSEGFSGRKSEEIKFLLQEIRRLIEKSFPDKKFAASLSDHTRNIELLMGLPNNRMYCMNFLSRLREAFEKHAQENNPEKISKKSEGAPSVNSKPVFETRDLHDALTAPEGSKEMGAFINEDPVEILKKIERLFQSGKNEFLEKSDALIKKLFLLSNPELIPPASRMISQMHLIVLCSSSYGLSDSTSFPGLEKERKEAAEKFLQDVSDRLALAGRKIKELSPPEQERITSIFKKVWPIVGRYAMNEEASLHVNLVRLVSVTGKDLSTSILKAYVFKEICDFAGI